MRNLERIAKKLTQSSSRAAAVVVNTGDANSYGVISNLGSVGVAVVSVSPDTGNITFFSRYAEKAVCPDFVEHESAFIDYLAELGRLLSPKPVLFVNGDEILLTILQYRERLESVFHIPFTSNELAEQFTDKTCFYRLLEEHGVPHARTYVTESLSDVMACADEDIYPCIIKPSQSQTFSRNFGNKCLPVDSKRELIELYQKVSREEDKIIVQERIEGTQRYLIYSYLSKDSEPRRVLIYEKIRIYPPEFGNATMCRTVIDEHLQDMVLNLLKKLNHHGLAEAEVQRDAKDGRLKVIEINIRTTTQSRLSAFAGTNMEYTAYQDMLGEPLAFRANSKPGLIWVDLYRDILAVFSKSDGYLSRKEITFRNWLRSLKGKRVFAFCNLRDPLPGLVLITRLLRMHLFSRERLRSLGTSLKRMASARKT